MKKRVAFYFFCSGFNLALAIAHALNGNTWGIVFSVAFFVLTGFAGLVALIEPPDSSRGTPDNKGLRIVDVDSRTGGSSSRS